MENNNSKYPAFPLAPSQLMGMSNSGLTKREYFAAMAMQGLLAPGVFQTPTDYQYTAELAIRMADELLKQLDK